MNSPEGRRVASSGLPPRAVGAPTATVRQLPATSGQSEALSKTSGIDPLRPSILQHTFDALNAQRERQEVVMLKIGSIVWGVKDVPRAIAFWCAALKYKPLREPSADWAILVPMTGEGQQMAITVVSSDAESHQRHHLDLYASDRNAEVERLLSLGARRVDWRYPEGADYVVLADPDGNTFCVIEKEM